MAVIWLGGAEIEEKVGIERWCLVGAKGNPRWEKDSGSGVWTGEDLDRGGGGGSMDLGGSRGRRELVGWRRRGDGWIGLGFDPDIYTEWIWVGSFESLRS